MAQSKISSAAFADTKPHYELLDGLRGVAALFVVWYHVFEGFAFAGGTSIDTFNHGYLAVDFFFILSGFVISYAYDDRWSGKMSMIDFFKRRLIRLHPMIIMGALIGCVTFLLQGSVKWNGSETPLSWVCIAFLLTCFFIPAYPGASYEIRGNGEMFPLAGPAWSLFFEYIGNICYAIFIRRLSTRLLAVWVTLCGICLSLFAIFNLSGYESIGVGWTLDTINFLGGFIRMIFPFSMGMLLARIFKPIRIRGIFWMIALVLFILFSAPFFPSVNGVCLNGVYEMFCIIIAFPVLVWLGASGITSDKISTNVCRFLGDLSYPLYLVHYPIMYLFYAWLIDNKLYTLSETWPVVACVYLLNILLAYTALKLYDEPVRKWLIRRFL